MRFTKRKVLPITGWCTPTDRILMIYRLDAGMPKTPAADTPSYAKPLLFGLGDHSAPLAFPELVIDVSSVFSDLPPLDETCG